MPFTPEQQQAIQAQNRELLVSAAAGSGKTAVLVERILRLVKQDGLSIDRMLIVTFTRAAAGEMRERLETRLTEAAEGDARLMRQADLVAEAQISTIHSYCQQVVRENFQLCGVDPQFMLADERTRAAYYRQSMEDTLDHLYTAAKQDAEIAALTRKFTERDLAAMIDTLYRFMMSRPDPLDWLHYHANLHWSEDSIDAQPMAQAFCREAALIVQGMQSLWQKADALRMQPAFPPPYINTLLSDRQTIADLAEGCEQGLSHLVGKLTTLKFVTLGRFKPAASDEEQLADTFKDLRARWKDMADELKKLLPVGFSQGVNDMQAMESATRGLEKAVGYFHQAFSERKRADALIDFGDLEHMTLSVLRLPEAGKRQADRFDAIFVDEYQDVSELQEAILNALKRPVGQSVFYVGDVKQSIYRFRLAEPALFLGKLAAFSQSEDAPQRRIVLNKNFRSKTAVLAAVNRVFEHVMDSRVTEIDYDADARLYPGLPSTGDPTCELHVLDSQSRRPQDAVLAEATFIARDILRTVGTPVKNAEGQPSGTLHYRDIAVLLPVSKNVADKVELVLSRAGIPVYCEGAADPMGSEEITQLLCHLQLIDNLMNDVALLSVLRGPLFDMTEGELAQIRLTRPEREASYLTALMAAAEEADAPLRDRCKQVLDTLERERFYARSMPLAEYLWDFLGRSGLYAHYGAQPGGKLRQANLRMLCHRAADHDQTRTDGLHGFLEALQTDGGAESGPAVLSPWEDVVRIMTIHKSKGLEFPTVYVMGLGRSLLGRASSKLISVHGKVGFGVEYVNEAMRTKRTTLLQGAIALSERNAERAERARVLYVALTRPKSRLVMVGSQSAKTTPFETLRERAQSGEKQDVFTVRSAKSMLDWVLQCLTPEDDIAIVEGDGFSTGNVRETAPEILFPTVSTSFPHKKPHWQVVFHNDPPILRTNAKSSVKLNIPLPDGLTAAEIPPCLPMQPRTGDPLAPALSFAHHPLKLGVTALCRALDGMETLTDAASEPAETADFKRLPLLAPKPRLLTSVPELPAFLDPPAEEAAVQRGVQTHKLLCLLPLNGIRAAREKGRLLSYIKEELTAFTGKNMFSKEQAALADARMAARFFESALGERVLKSPKVMREWSFNLRISEPFSAILQGVIDLCFLENDAWVLVDFKTDRVQAAADLWPRYEKQLAYYRRALEAGTPYPVKETALFSLRLGRESAKCD